MVLKKQTDRPLRDNNQAVNRFLYEWKPDLKASWTCLSWNKNDSWIFWGRRAADRLSILRHHVFEWVLTVVWEAWLNGNTIAQITISPLCIPECLCGCAFICMCGCVCLINTNSIRALNWAECEIWQACVGLCGLPLHSNKNETCWHEYQMSEGVCWELSSITIWMIVAWKGRQSFKSIFQYPGTDGATRQAGKLLSIRLKCQVNVTCKVPVWGGGCQWVTFNLCVFNKSGWSWAVKSKSVFKLCLQLVTLRVTQLDRTLFIWTSYTHSQMTIRCCVW